jgi:hypothetical protein
VQVLREFGVKGSGEGPAARPADRPHFPAERAFSGDMDGAGHAGIDQLRQPAARRHGQPDLGVAGHRQAEEAVRPDHLYHVTGGPQHGRNDAEGADDTIDLR